MNKAWNRAALAALSLCACGLTPKLAADANLEVRALADEVWDDRVANSTLLRLQQGLPIEGFEDRTLVAWHEAAHRTARFRQELSRIEPGLLSGDDLTTYRILAFELRETGATDDDYWLQFDVTPNQAPYYFQVALQALDAQKIADQPGTGRFLDLVGELGDFLDQLAGKVEGQAERGIYLSRAALPATRATWSGLRDDALGAVRVKDDRLATLEDADRQVFRDTLETFVARRIEPGFARLFESIGDAYERRASPAVGLGQYPGGAAVYQRLIESSTTLDLSPEEIHHRGLAAVDEISGRMATLRRELGFDGTAAAFLENIRGDPRFIARSPAEVETRYLDYIRRIEPRLGEYFTRMPKAPYGVRRLALAAEPGMTYGYYSAPTPEEPEGLYHYNGSKLEQRSLVWSGSLIYHELLPGHHFHLATQFENQNLQTFRRKYSVDAFTEGWAEYAAGLAGEMGMYADAREQYGRCLAEMFFALRLVVDTGMNALGWPLERAREFMALHAIQSADEIDSELLRYSTSIPAQALAYRLGYEKFRELRHLAASTLGKDFDIRKFHAIVLGSGARPLPALESDVREWIGASKGR